MSNIITTTPEEFARKYKAALGRYSRLYIEPNGSCDGSDDYVVRIQNLMLSISVRHWSARVQYVSAYMTYHYAADTMQLTQGQAEELCAAFMDEYKKYQAGAIRTEWEAL